jgi:glycosyltransferase involved in cell wall biosynthesis
MKITYIANVRMPTEKAHGIQIMKMCAAFRDAGHEVILVVPWRFNAITQDPFVYYSIQTRFPIKRIFSIDLVWFGSAGFRIQSLSFALAAFFYTLVHRSDVVFGRDELPVLLASMHSRTVWETHTGSYTFFARMLIRTQTRIIAITEGLKRFYINKGVEEERILVAPDSVDIEQFDIDISKDDARKKLGLPLEDNIVLYTGHLYDWKGAHVLAKATQYSAVETQAVFVGGTDKDIHDFKKRFGHSKAVLILGKKPYDQIPIYLKAADVLVLPNSPVNDISSLYTSPMKLFEYMASGRPIVASDLPSIREILNGSNAVLVAPDDPQQLAEGILKVLEDEPFSQRISARSYEDSKQYTWKKRALSIISFIKA